MNGKSNNMNNVLMQIYPTGSFIPSNELIAVFDADQIAKPDFFVRTVPLFDAGDNIGMVSRVQGFGGSARSEKLGPRASFKSPLPSSSILSARCAVDL